MSEEFLRVAKKEVSEDISCIGQLQEGCISDDDIFKKANEIEKHIHKLKGLAPMMGQTEIGDIATMLDSLFKAMLGGTQIEGIHKTLAEAQQFMQQKISGEQADNETLAREIRQKHAKFL